MTNQNPTNQTSRVIAVAGKGGTGKTTLTTIMVKLLSERGMNILAVDADPPVSLTYALGAEPVSTVGDLRARLIDDPAEKRRVGDRHMGDVVRDELVIHTSGVDLLVLGQAEGAGCFCGLNELLKFGIESLSKRYDVTLIDCEAGIEQINRRVVNSIDTLVMVSDPTAKGIRTAVRLKEIAQGHGVSSDYQAGLILNRVDEGLDDLTRQAKKHGLDIWGVIPVDPNVAAFDRQGLPTILLPPDSAGVIAAKNILKKLGFND